MKASAPGKLVLSGAYAVLRGSPAIVTAVDRRVVVDTERPPTFEAREVLTLLERRWPDEHTRPRVPFADATALRHEGGKLGLGSSAALTVASLRVLCPELSPREAFEEARLAHRIAQGGGSGIDVLASTLGGTSLARCVDEELEWKTTTLPQDLVFEVWALPTPAVTSDFVAKVFALEKRSPHEFTERFGAQRTASEVAAEALARSDSPRFVAALAEQFAALRALGTAAAIPIITPEMEALARYIGGDAALLPAGAGGGDIVFHVAPSPSSREFRTEAERHSLFRLDLALGAPGVRLET